MPRAHSDDSMVLIDFRWSFASLHVIDLLRRADSAACELRPLAYDRRSYAFLTR